MAVPLCNFHANPGIGRILLTSRIDRKAPVSPHKRRDRQRDRYHSEGARRGLQAKRTISVRNFLHKCSVTMQVSCQPGFGHNMTERALTCQGFWAVLLNNNSGLTSGAAWWIGPNCKRNSIATTPKFFCCSLCHAQLRPFWPLNLSGRLE